jgi:hypothetical protein
MLLGCRKNDDAVPRLLLALGGAVHHVGGGSGAWLKLAVNALFRLPQ